MTQEDLKDFQPIQAIGKNTFQYHIVGTSITVFYKNGLLQIFSNVFVLKEFKVELNKEQFENEVKSYFKMTFKNSLN